MSPDETRRVFETVLASAPPSTIDIDAAVRAGRRRRRSRPVAVAASVAALLVAGGFALAAIQPDVNPQPTAVVANMDAIQSLTAGDGALVLSVSELLGSWQTVQLDGQDVTEARDRSGQPLFVQFLDQDGTWWWANDGCNDWSGRLTVTSEGTFTAAPGGATLVGCLSGDHYPRNPEVVMAAHEARILPATDGEQRRLLLIEDGTVLAVYVFQPDVR